MPEIGKGMDKVGALSGRLDHENPAANHAAGREAADLQRAVYRRMQSDYEEAISVVHDVIEGFRTRSSARSARIL